MAASMSMCSAVDLALLSYQGVNGRAFEALQSDASLPELLQVSQKRATSKLAEKNAPDVERYRDALRVFEDQGGHILGREGVGDLGHLLRAPTPPLCAYMRGDPSLLKAPLKVAMVGTRKPSERGLARARDIAAQLTQAGILVISGGAIGIDLAAHEGALGAGGATLAVLGDPLNAQGDERPSRLKRLRPPEKLSTLTLFGPWVPASKKLYVMRNQYVAALADAVVIVEARPQSGTLHTARYANKMGVPVWAIPGDPSDEMAETNNWLLEQGLARALVHLDYFAASLGSQTVKKAPQMRQTEMFSAQQDALMMVFRANNGRLTIDELMEKCEAELGALQQELLMLELLGAVKKQGTEFILV